jgi:Protein of unknown function (DUF2384)
LGELSNEKPLEIAQTEVGARVVEQLLAKIDWALQPDATVAVVNQTARPRFQRWLWPTSLEPIYELCSSSSCR